MTWRTFTSFGRSRGAVAVHHVALASVRLQKRARPKRAAPARRCDTLLCAREEPGVAAGLRGDSQPTTRPLLSPRSGCHATSGSSVDPEPRVFTTFGPPPPTGHKLGQRARSFALCRAR